MRMNLFSVTLVLVASLVGSHAAAQGVVRLVPDEPSYVDREATQPSPGDLVVPTGVGDELEDEAWQRDVGIGWKDDCKASACDPLWNVYVGALILHRSSPNNMPDVEIPNVNYDWELGLDVDARRRLRNDYQLQLRYFGVDNWDDTVDGLTFFSNLHSTEVNLRRQRSDRLALLAGFRWVEMSDYFFDAHDFIDTNNHMYGGQIGAEWLAWDRGGPFTVTTGLKGGIYYNEAGYEALFEQIAVDSRTSHTGFLGEWDIMARYKLSDRWTFRAGYQLVWLEGVASVDAGQITAVLHGDPPTTDGSPFYHGATVGVEFHW